MNLETKKIQKNKLFAVMLGVFLALFVFSFIEPFVAVPVAHARSVAFETGGTGSSTNMGITVVSSQQNGSSFTYNLAVNFDGQQCSGNTGPCVGRTFVWSQNGNSIAACPNNLTCSITVSQGQSVVIQVDSSQGGSQPLSASTTVVGGTTQATGGGGSTSQQPSAYQCFIDGNLKCIVEMIVTYIGSIITGILFWLYGEIVLPLIQTALSIQPHSPEFASIILPVWIVVRNLMNILFVIALIILGLSTLIGRGNYRSTLVRIALTALLLNFSLVIAQAILGIADALQAQFLPNNSQVLGFLGASLIKGPTDNLWNGILQQQGMSWASILTVFIYILFAFGALVVLAAVAAYLLLRIVLMWFMLFSSPIGYAFFAMDFTKGYAKRWWDNFLKWAFFTPVLALLLHICAVLANAQSLYISKVLGTTFTASTYPQAAQFIYNALSNILLFACLLYALQVAKNLGGAWAGKVSDTASKWVRKPVGAAGGYLKSGATSAGKSAVSLAQRFKQNQSAKLVANPDGSSRTGVAGTLGRATFNVLNPKTSFKQYQKGQQEKRENAAAVATAAAMQARAFRVSHGLDTSKPIADIDKKHRDQQIENKLKMGVVEMDKRLGELKDIIANSKNSPIGGPLGLQAKEAKQQIEYILAAKAQKGAVTGTPDQIVAQIKKYTGEDTELLKKILVAINRAGDKTNNLGLIGVDKYYKGENDLDLEAMRQKQLDKVKDLLAQGKLNEIRVSKLQIPEPPAGATPEVRRQIEALRAVDARENSVLNQIKNAMRSAYNENLTKKQQGNINKDIKEFIGARDETQQNQAD